MVSFENFVKSMPPSLSELKALPSFCFAFKIPDDVTATTRYLKSKPPCTPLLEFIIVSDVKTEICNW